MIPHKTKYVVYRIDTGYALYKNPTGYDLAFYETKGPATRLANRLNELSDFAAVCTIEEYTHGICPDYENGEVKMVERTNLMTGKNTWSRLTPRSTAALLLRPTGQCKTPNH